MKDIHLVPIVIQDIVNKLPNVSGNEKFMIQARLNAIITYCQKALKNG